MRLLRLVGAGLVLTGVQVGAHELHLVEPRAFGHLIGDPLTRTVSVDVAADEQLLPGLPKLGRVDPWVELVERRVRREHRPGGDRVVVLLRYQLVNSPLQLQIASVPGGELAWTKNGRTEIEPLPSWTLSMAPMTTPDLRDGLEAIRPSRSAVTMPIRRDLWMAGGGLLLALAGALGLGIERGFFRRWRRRRGPFAEVARQLRSPARQRPVADGAPQALLLLHRAFDATAGHPVFGEQLELFLTAHPQFAPLRNDIEAFFDASRGQFYGGVPTAMSVATLLRLSRRLGDLERRRPARPQ